jgi:hypothetical protein
MVTMSVTENASEAIKATVLGAAGDDVRVPQIDGRALAHSGSIASQSTA